jgi:hypothetical protein
MAGCQSRLRGRFALAGLLLAAGLAAAGLAEAHGLAGNRFFPGTLAFDDPAVGDELDFPLVDVLDGMPGGIRDVDYAFQFTRLLTPTIALGVASGVTQQFQNGRAQRTGFQQTSVELKARIWEDDIHETLASASLVYSIGASGTAAVGNGGPDTLAPGVFFGQGFGALPDRLAWLRPFGVSGAFAPQFPLEGRSAASAIGTSGLGTSGELLGSEATAGSAAPAGTKNPIIINWGFSIQYSNYYLTDRFTGGPAAAEPLHQFVPLVEFAVASPLQDTAATRTVATANPGLAYVGSTWQVAAEAALPLDRGAGHGVGGRLQLLLFLDDLVPALFGEPILGR